MNATSPQAELHLVPVENTVKSYRGKEGMKAK